MSDIDERTQAREAALREQLEERRAFRHTADYLFDKAQEAYWDKLTGSLHGPLGVDSSIPQERWRVVVEAPPEQEGAAPARGRPRRPRERLIKPSSDIARVENDQFVEGATWWPGKPQIIPNWYIDSSGYYPMMGARIFNKFRPMPELWGDANEAGPWVDHVKRLWPDPREHEYFFDYCAHMLQKPHEKCNAAIVLSGKQGIGKDAALLPIKMAIGAWNTKGIDPDDLFSQFKPWVETLMLVVDEVRPTKEEYMASSMYNIMKPLIAAPPEVLPLNDKFAKLRYVINVLRLFITTNDYLSMYIPEDDRRMFIMHSTLQDKWHIAAGFDTYFFDLFNWIQNNGAGHVAAWLRARDLCEFDPKGQVEKTLGWSTISNTWGAPEDAVTAVLEKLKRPDVFFGAELMDEQFDHIDEIRGMLKSPRKIGHRLQREGYIMMKNPDSDRWAFRHEGTNWRSRFAFIRQELLREPARAVELIKARGETIVKQKGKKDEPSNEKF